MNKKNFAQLKKMLKRADRVFLQNHLGRVYMSDCHFIVWMPEDVYRQYVADDFLPSVAAGERLDYVRELGVWNACTIHLPGRLDESMREEDPTIAYETSVRMAVGRDGMQVVVIDAKDSLVFLADHYFKMASDLCGLHHLYASRRIAPVWFYDRVDFKGIGCWVLPVNANPSQFRATVEKLLQKVPA